MMSGNETILEVQNLKKYFKTKKGDLHAIDDVSFKIKTGTTLGVVGESGCGKSTLGRTILHLHESTGGKIFFQGEDVTKVEKDRLKKLREDMQIIFQDPYSSLNPRMSVSEIIREPLKRKGGLSKEQLNQEVERLMDIVGLAQRFANSYPHELDGGRRQRIGIARALSLNPKFIVCDEPVSALDVSIQAQILNLMKDLQAQIGLTYIFITHDLSVVKHMSDDICVMYLGQMVEKAPAKELFYHPKHPYTKALLSAIPVPKVNIKRKRIILKGEITSPINPKPGCRFAARCDYADKACEEMQQLEEIGQDHFVSCCRYREIKE
ncbi:ATP-binding cassette domain-containing protein [Clostridium sp. MCC353]|uniref:ABC transporter ATP-binding protein n=1 Tax=Clostridium sp. MCC353 TaxID=2592646 RepID=UPI001C033780|nr:oligopeptide/dipeptide ABC transporter ATP-binding protein [Clostridium sp. MCC353]MBT9775485.1 ATP-binding cassette domain-containing protein [Clostridium sp. MCC353]